MAPIDLFAQPDLTDQLNKDETGSVEEGRDRGGSYLTGVGDGHSSLGTAEKVLK